MRIDIWSDIACPWCYIGLTRFGRALERFEHSEDVEVELHSFQLDPTLPESFEGTEADYLAASKGLDVADVHAMTRQVSAAAATEGLTLDFDSLVVTNSRRAHRLLQYAKGVSGQATWDLELALLTAHFTDGLSISDPDTVAALADRVGIEPDAARAALDSPELDAAVTADVDAAAQLGIRGVPFFVLNGKYGVSGAQPPELFDSALQQVWDEEHPA
ncbi:MAG: DsbA family oxidoreductase [Propionicimonas sp.]|uniref:DsbA family oxidoreductase n=1 Tax=Propionicimonas sp. TaxID=1955623 RepID=UPI003D0F32C5